VIKRIKHFIDRAKRGTRSVQQALLYAGLNHEQKFILHMLWLRVNLPVPPLPEQNEQMIAQCRDLGIAEWRIHAVVNSRPDKNH
jgi:hypothetical protein